MPQQWMNIRFIYKQLNCGWSYESVQWCLCVCVCTSVLFKKQLTTKTLGLKWDILCYLQVNCSIINHWKEEKLRSTSKKRYNNKIKKCNAWTKQRQWRPSSISTNTTTKTDQNYLVTSTLSLITFVHRILYDFSEHTIIFTHPLNQVSIQYWIKYTIGYH